MPESDSTHDDSPMLVCRHVGKVFRDSPVLIDVNLDVACGEKLAIIGPSGSGKTTFLRIAMALEQPTEGSVKIDGEQLWGDLKPRERDLRRIRAKVGYVFQQFNLFPHMTALRNITEAPMHVRGVPKKEAEERGLALLDMVGLQRKAHSYPAQLSGGEQQRVAIARALALDPKVMLFDEVTSALDPELVGEVLRVVAGLALQSNMTMLIVTHEMNFARRVADRVVFFDGGRIVEQGPPAKIFANPSEERTRAFLKAVLDPV